MRPDPKQEMGTKEVSNLREWEGKGGQEDICPWTGSPWGRSNIYCFAHILSLHLLSVKYMSDLGS